MWDQNPVLQKWISETIALCRPDKVHLCDGSEEEFNTLSSELVSKGFFIPLNPQKRPGSFACFSDPSDVARVEEATFICSDKVENAGPTNNWKDP